MGGCAAGPASRPSPINAAATMPPPAATEAAGGAPGGGRGGGTGTSGGLSRGTWQRAASSLASTQ
eukprot:13484420-Heterocapsa_arctica.AAC.1